jgi:hypothetical protein
MPNPIRPQPIGLPPIGPPAVIQRTFGPGLPVKAAGSYPKLATLTDNFNVNGAVNVNQWACSNGADVLVASQTLQITIPASSASYQQLYAMNSTNYSRFDLTGSYCSIQCASAGNQSLTSLECYPLYLTDEPWSPHPNKLFWYINQNGLGTYKMLNGVQSQVGSTITYNPAVHVWFRIREATGTTYFDYSTDGTNWTNFSSTPDIPDCNEINLWVQNGTYNVETTATTCIYDNLSTGPPSIVRAANFPQYVSPPNSFTATWSNVGDLAIVCGASFAASGDTISGISSSKVSGWQQVVDGVDATDNGAISLWMGTVTATGADTLTVTWTTVPSSYEVMVDEFTALNANGSAWSQAALGGGSLRAPSSPWSYPGLTSGVAAAFPLQFYWGYQQGQGTPGGGSGTGFAFLSTSDGSYLATNTTLVANTAYQPSSTGFTSAVFSVAGIFSYGAPVDATSPSLSGTAGMTIGGLNTEVASSAMAAASTLTVTPVNKFSSLIETFTGTSLNSSIWSFSGTNVGIVSNQLQITNTASTAQEYQCFTQGFYDLTSSQLAIQLVSSGNESINSWENYPIILQDSGGTNRLYWYILQGFIAAYKVVASTVTQVFSASYSATTHAWLRIREASGTTYWEYSSDGINWTSAHSEADPITETNLRLIIQAGTYNAETLTTAALYDNINIPPITVTLAATAGMTIGASVTEIAAVTLAGGAALTVPAVVTEIASVAESGTAGMTIGALVTEKAAVALAASTGMTSTASVTEVASVAEAATTTQTITASLTVLASAMGPNPNLLSADDQDFEGSVGTWTATSICTIAQTTAQANTGTHSLAVTSTASSGIVQATSGRYAANPGWVYAYRLWVRAATTTRVPAILATYINSSLAQISSFSIGATESNSAWNQTPATTSIAPPGTAWITVGWQATNVPIGEVHYTDTIQLYQPAGANAVLTVTAYVTEVASVAHSATAGMTIGASVTEIAAVTLSATAGLTVPATVTEIAAVALSGSASLTVPAVVTEVATVTEAATAGMTIGAAVTEVASIAESATAGMSVTATTTPGLTVTLAAGATLTITAIDIEVAVVAESAGAALTVAATVTEQAVVSLASTTGLVPSGITQEVASVAEAATTSLSPAATVQEVATVAAAGTASLSVTSVVTEVASVTEAASAAISVGGIGGGAALRSTSSGSTGATTATSFTIAQPTGLSVGDWCLLWVDIGNTTRTATATGFTAVTASSGNSQSPCLLYRQITGSESWPLTVTLSGAATDAVGIIYAAQGANGLDPVPTSSGQTNASSTTISVPGITTTSANDLLVWFGATSSASGGTPNTITAPSGFTARGSQVNDTQSAATNLGALVADATQSSAGASGAQNGTIASPSRVTSGVLVALSPAGGGVYVTEIASTAQSATAGMTIGASVTEVATVSMAATAFLGLTPIEIGSATLAASAAITVVSTVTEVAVVALAGSTSLTAAATVKESAIVALSGSTSLTAAATLTRLGVAALSGTAGLTIAASVIEVASIPLAASTTLTVITYVQVVATVSLSATASMSVTGVVIHVVSGAVALSAQATLVPVGILVAAGAVTFNPISALSLAAGVMQLASAYLAATTGMVVLAEVIAVLPALNLIRLGAALYPLPIAGAPPVVNQAVSNLVQARATLYPLPQAGAPASTTPNISTVVRTPGPLYPYPTTES